ncbi:MAG TPA: glycosyltransferase 87 family protein [Edaphobacter sp.]|nr:glycosyltransferase 87 family protein [Edaphobacter sp.]
MSAAWLTFQDFPTNPLFADTRTVTHSIDCLANGKDPYVVRSFDPWHRLYNYPPIWLDFRFLGVTSRSSNLIGSLMAIAMVATLLFLFNAKTLVSAAIIFFAVISPSVLLAIERGNIDQIIFFLLVFGLVLIDQCRESWKTFLKGFLIILLTVLKIYPVAAVAIFVRNRKGILAAMLASALSLIALLLTAGHRLARIFENTPRESLMTFGAVPFFRSITSPTFHRLAPIIQDHYNGASFGAIFMGVLSLLAGAALGGRLERFLPPIDRESTRGNIAIAGLAIFCVSFTLGANYDYRLIFLLPGLACLIEDVNQNMPQRSLPAIILILLLLWKPTNLSSFGEVVDGLVFVLVSGWLGNSLLSRRRKSRSTLSLRSGAFSNGLIDPANPGHSCETSAASQQ